MIRSRVSGKLVGGLFMAIGVSIPSSAFADGDPSKGRTLARTECSHCHGQDGNARSTSIQIVPMLAGQPAKYLVQEMINYAEGVRKDTSRDGNMAKKLQALTTRDFEDIAAFYEVQKRY